ncbi:hypothetical protein M378DRAFT_76424 [Amanita muscaria Koide BX008]|uniref:MFS general substrate transporter n=1 Tax=Amanita muscaria (strain Koide BX008) TaxID=946122 RepID=A0A0C2XAH4_AMAMK|nr:hypothetical protein M378DRAFT_76424 [Amanita muscaria Koide BX008]
MTNSDSEEERLLLTPSHHYVVGCREGWREIIPSLRQFRDWNAHPYWYVLIPVVLAMNMSTGMTTAPEIQVYRAIACRSLYGLSPDIITDCSGTDVAARVAKIQAAVGTTTSILTAISTGFWSRFGDTYGRKPIFVLNLLGAIFSESSFILVMRPNTIFSRYAEIFILFGPIVEGLSGGLATFLGLLHAYISDCTRHGSRSKIFSTIYGIFYIGLSAGPWFTGMVLSPGASTDLYFYISMATLAMSLLYTLAILPESRKRESDVDSSHRTNENQIKPSALVVLHGYILRFLAALVSPIVMFAPRSLKGYPQKRTYILTFLGLGVFIHTVSNGLYQTRYVFAQHLYSWSTAQLGYYVSLLSIIKAANLLVILPIVISYSKPKTSSAATASLSPRELVAELQFDRQITQASLVLECVSHLLVVLLSRNSEAVFVVLSCAGSFTSGVNPALYSLGAICLHACGYSSEVGALFGAKAVLAAIAYAISPTIFATTYAATVAYFPQAMFVLATVLISMSVAFISAIRPSLGDINLVYDSTTAEELSRLEEERT